MGIDLGISLELPGPDTDPDEWAALAVLAERRDLDLVVVGTDSGGDTAGLDPWTAAAWLVGATQSIAIGVAHDDLPAPDPADPEAPYPTVVGNAQETLDVLAPARLLVGASHWVTAPRHARPAEVSTLAAAGLPVVVPVGSVVEVEQVAAMAADHSRDATGPHRTVASRARRLPGIDYDGIPPSLADSAVEPGDPGYRAVSSTYLRGGRPGLVLRPRTPAEVADAVAFARRHRHLPLGIRSGGHGVSGRSTNRDGLVIDVGRLAGIDILDPDRRLVRIGPGATWKQVAEALHPHGWALGSGDYGGVGVGGLATAGGIGLLSRKHGLTIDHLKTVELVLADGSHVRTDEAEDPDLFWAVRGAGANFGIATAFEFQVSEVGDVGWAQLVLVTDDIEGFLRAYGQVAEAARRDTTVFLVTGRPRDGQSVVQLFGVVDDPDPDVIVERLTPFARLGRLVQQQVVVTPYRDVMGLAADVGPEGQQGYGDPVSRSAFLPALTPEFAHDAAELLHSGRVYFFELRHMGGAIADADPGETAFTHRSPAFQVAAMGSSDRSLNPVWDPLRRHFDGLYLSFETDLRPERLEEAFPAPALARLRELKRRYDPGNLFRDNFNIDPDPGTPVAAERAKETTP